MTVRLLFTFSFQYFFWATGAMNCTECAFSASVFLLLLLLLYSHLRLDTLFLGYDRNCEFIVPIRKVESVGWEGGQGKCKHSKFITTTTTMNGKPLLYPALTHKTTRGDCTPCAGLPWLRSYRLYLSSEATPPSSTNYRGTRCFASFVKNYRNAFYRPPCYCCYCCCVSTTEFKWNAFYSFLNIVAKVKRAYKLHICNTLFN